MPEKNNVVPVDFKPSDVEIFTREEMNFIVDLRDVYKRKKDKCYFTLSEAFDDFIYDHYFHLHSCLMDDPSDQKIASIFAEYAEILGANDGDD